MHLKIAICQPELLLGQNTYIIFLLQERHDDLQVIVSAIGKNAQMPKVTPLMMNEIEKVRSPPHSAI